MDPRYQKIEDAMRLSDMTSPFYNNKRYKVLNNKDPSTLTAAEVEEKKQIEAIREENREYAELRRKEKRLENLPKEIADLQGAIANPAKEKDKDLNEKKLHDATIELQNLQSQDKKKSFNEIHKIKAATIAKKHQVMALRSNRVVDAFVRQKNPHFKEKAMSLAASPDYQIIIDIAIRFREKSDPRFRELSKKENRTPEEEKELQDKHLQIEHDVRHNPDRAAEYQFHYRNQVAALYNEDPAFHSLVDKQIAGSITPDEQVQLDGFDAILEKRVAKRAMLFEYEFEAAKRENWPKDDIEGQRRRAADYVSATDFSKPDEVRFGYLPKGQALQQYQEDKSTWVGGFFTNPSDSNIDHVHQLGIASTTKKGVVAAFTGGMSVAKVVYNHEVTDDKVAFARSSPDEFVDSWSLGKAVLVPGGGTQYRVSEKEGVRSTDNVEKQLQHQTKQVDILKNDPDADPKTLQKEQSELERLQRLMERQAESKRERAKATLVRAGTLRRQKSLAKGMLTAERSKDPEAIALARAKSQEQTEGLHESKESKVVDEPLSPKSPRAGIH